MLVLQCLNKILHRIQNSKAPLKDKFDAYREEGLYTLELHLLDHVVEELDRFECLERLSSLSDERLKVHIKRAYSSNAQRNKSALGETLSAVDINTRNRKQDLRETRMTMRRAVSEKLARVSTTYPFLVGDGSEKKVYCVENALQAEHVPESATEQSANMLALLETDATKTFVGSLKDLARQAIVRYSFGVRQV